jgi:hypothetical protein
MLTLNLKQEILLQLEQLPTSKLQEALNFIRFLVVKDELFTQQLPFKRLSQRDILVALQQLHDKNYGHYGIYQGDLVAEARAEREQSWEGVFGLSNHQVKEELPL